MPDSDAKGSSDVRSSSAVSVVEIGGVLVARRQAIGRVSLGMGLLAAVGVSILPATWTTTASFVAANQRATAGIGNLGGLAAQFGVAIPGADATQAPAFYVALVHAAEVLVPVLYAPTGTERVVDAIGAAGADSAVREQRALGSLRKLVQPAASTRTGIVSITVSTTDPQLSFDITRHVLASLDRAYASSRRVQATNERRFTEARLGEVKENLERAEDAQRRFLQLNRRYSSSPELSLEFDRLARAVSLQQTLYTTLAQALEQARIDEVRDTPVLSVIDRPRVAASAERRRVVLKTLIGVVAGALLASAWVLGMEMIRRLRPWPAASR